MHAWKNLKEVARGLDRRIDNRFGIQIDAARNQQNAKVISAEGAPVAVRVIPTDEEVVIARCVLSNLGLKIG